MKKIKTFSNFLNESIPFRENEYPDINKDLIEPVLNNASLIRKNQYSTVIEFKDIFYCDGIIGEFYRSREFSNGVVTGYTKDGKRASIVIEGHGAETINEFRFATSEEISIYKTFLNQ